MMDRVNFKNSGRMLILLTLLCSVLFLNSIVSAQSMNSKHNIDQQLIGTTNLSLYRPASVSSQGFTPGLAEFAVDGECDTAWRSLRPQTKLTDTTNSLTDPQWIEIDLQAPCQTNCINIKWESDSKQPVYETIVTGMLGNEQITAYGTSYSVSTSLDGQQWNQIYSTTLGSGGLEKINIQPTSLRFVRVNITKRSHDSWIGISEIQVMGTCSEHRPPVTSWKLRRKDKTKPTLAKKLSDDGTMPLNTGWELQREDWLGLTASQIADPKLDTNNWYNATVPGTVLTTLVNQEVFQDPITGLKNLNIPESLAKHNWWYRCQLKIPSSYKLNNNNKLWLEFDGINHCAEIWLNGTKLGTIEGAFIRGKYDITNIVNKKDNNILAVRIIPPAHPGIAVERKKGVKLFNGGAQGKDSPTMLASIGWDWMPGVRDRGIGIWNKVRLRNTGPVIIGDTQIITDLPLPATNKADITIKIPLQNNSNIDQSVTLNAAFGNVQLSRDFNIKANETLLAEFTPATDPQLTINNPKLWWPNGYGDPVLHNLKISASLKKAITDKRQMRFGIREISYRGTELVGLESDGSENQPKEMELSVNGHKISCRGGNWGYPEMLLRISRERIETSVKLHNEANMNTIRNWIGMSTFEDFYDLCDEYGILIWNDFWLANPCDGPDPDNNELFMSNVNDAISRYRNHPSIAVWCGRNEGMPPEALDNGMRDSVKNLDGTRYYQSHSSDIGVCGGGPYKYLKPLEYFTNAVHGYKTELGMPSVPRFESALKMVGECDSWPTKTSVWEYHDFVPQGNQYTDLYTNALEQSYGKAKDLQDYCNKAQLQNYEIYRSMFEAGNHHLWNDSSGLFLWMSHPAWSSTVWQIYDYWFDLGGAFYGAKKANEPIHVQLSRDDWSVEAINHTTKEVNGTVIAHIIDQHGTILKRDSMAISAPADKCTKAFQMAWSDFLPNLYFVKLKWLDNDGKLLSENFYWLGKEAGSTQELESMPKTKLDTNIKFKSDTVTVELENKTQTIAFMSYITLKDKDTGTTILPAFYSDNYITLLPGEKTVINITCNQKISSDKMTVDLDGWNLDKN